MKALLPVLLFLGLVACKQPPPAPPANLQQLRWMVGDWVGTYNGEPFYESWRMVHDSLMLNFALDVSPVDTTLKENGFITLTSEGVIHGNANYSWKTEKLTDDEVVFVNPNIPYATRISWKHDANDHWIADIENPNGRIGYDLTRIDWLAPIVDGYMLAADKLPQ
jgi:hypothetical protein